MLFQTVEMSLENELICSGCEECHRHPSEFVKVVLGFSHDDHDAFVVECTQHLVKQNGVDGFCMTGGRQERDHE